MRDQVMKESGTLAIVAVAFLAGLILTQSPGTIDVPHWLSWIEDERERADGLVHGSLQTTPNIRPWH